MSEHSSNPVDQHLRPDETVIWKGRPEGAGTDAGVPVKKGGGFLGRIVMLAVFGAVALFVINQNEGLSLDQIMPAQLSDLPLFPIIAVVVIVFVLPVVFKALKIDGPSRVKKYLGSMGFAITDQRVIVADRYGEYSFGPAQLKMEIDDLGDGLADLRLGRRARKSSSGSSSNRTNDPVARERRWVGFKRVRNAEELRQKLEDWAAEHTRKAEEKAAAFVRGDATAMKAIQNPKLGVELIAPSHWNFEARHKKEPFGKTFVDNDNWRPLGQTDDWNVVRMRGPLEEMLMLELFETEPTATLDSMTGKVASMVLGKPIATDENVVIGDWNGFSLTREPRFTFGMPQVQKDYVLHNGTHQLYLSTLRPQDCPQTERAMETVLKSVELR